MSERTDRIRVHIEGKEYQIVGGKFQEMLVAVKQINGRRFVSELKVWQLPGKAEEIQNQLEISGYYLEGGMLPAETAPAAPKEQAAANSGSDRIRVRAGGHAATVVGGSFQEMLEAVKGVPGRRFDGDSKIWELPGEVSIIKQLIEAAGFQLEGIDIDNLPPLKPPAKKLEPADFGPKAVEPPPFEELEFDNDEDIPLYEAPDWWDDEKAPPPPPAPPDWWQEESTIDPAEAPPEAEFVNPDRVKLPPAASANFDSNSNDQIRIRVGGIPFIISGASFQQMLATIKSLPGRRFDSEDKTWDIPGDMGIEGFKKRMATAGYMVQRG